MKTMIALAILSLSGCVSYLPSKDLASLESQCREHNGIDQVSAAWGFKSQAECQDGKVVVVKR